MKKLRFLPIVSAVCFLGLSAVSCGKTDASFDVYAPDGAPALFLSEAMEKGGKEKYHIVDAQTISAFVSGKNPKAELCVLPLNLATKLLGTGENYVLLSVATHGNLYLVSSSLSEIESANGLAELKGKKVGVIQLANVPGLTFKSILKNAEIPYKELKNGESADGQKVNLVAVDASQILPQNAGGTCDAYVVAEPAASLKVKKTSLRFIGDLQKLYGENGYPQAVLVAKKTFVQKNKKWVKEYLETLSGVKTYLQTAEISTLVSTVKNHLLDGLSPTFTSENLTREVVERCGVYYTSAVDAKSEILSIVNSYREINAQSASVPMDGFFYQAN